MNTIRNAATQAASMYCRFPMFAIADAIIMVALLYWAQS